jgi:hypothetical protein
LLDYVRARRAMRYPRAMSPADTPPSAPAPGRDLLGVGCNALVLGLTLLGLVVGAVGWALVAVLSMRGTDGVHRDVFSMACASAVPSLVAIALAVVGLKKARGGLEARRTSVLFAAAALGVLIAPALAFALLLGLAPRTP